MITEDQMKRVFKKIQILKSTLDKLEEDGSIAPGARYLTDDEIEVKTFYQDEKCFTDVFCVIKIKEGNDFCSVQASSILGWRDKDFKHFEIKKHFDIAINKAWMLLCERFMIQSTIINEIW